jgi:hypothetical protein
MTIREWFMTIREWFIILFLNSIILFLKSKPNSFSEFNRSLPEETEAAFTFWNGIDFLTQVHILELCSSCHSLIALSFFAIKSGVILCISWSNSRISGIFHGRFIVKLRHPCKDPANKKLPGFSFVIKAILSECEVSFTFLSDCDVSFT